jgi:hypothetical protein
VRLRSARSQVRFLPGALTLWWAERRADASKVERIVRIVALTLVPFVFGIATGCGNGERALSLPDLKAGLRAAGAGPVHVIPNDDLEYVQVSVDADILLVRFEAVSKATYVFVQTRESYNRGTRVPRLVRACNVLIYNLAKEPMASRSSAARLAHGLRNQCE